MCIVYLHSDPNCSKSNYKLILAANRDEFYERPSAAANYLDSNANVLCGLDLEEDVSGGTWLGVTRTGKFAFLTNILKSSVDSSKPPRGTIVRSYLESDLRPEKYVQQKLVGVPFRPYNFVAGQLMTDSDSIELRYYGTEQCQPVKLQDGFHTVTCTALGNKWNKATHGSSLFTELVVRARDLPPNIFKDEIFNSVLSDTSCLYPDKLIEEQFGYQKTEQFLRKYCSVMIKGLEKYGTVAQTVVLVDKDNHMYFYEKSLRNAAWEYREYDHDIEVSR